MKLFEVHHYHHNYNEQQLVEILTGIQTLLRKSIKMSSEMQKVIDEVTELKTVNGSAISLLKKLGTMIKDNIEDKAALLQIASDLDTEGKAISDAVVENTPAE